MAQHHDEGYDERAHHQQSFPFDVQGADQITSRNVATIPTSTMVATETRCSSR